MSFYVTLPSNSSMDLYPENTMTEFTVNLKEPIRLETQYEVALVELTYKHAWSINVGRLLIDLNNNKQYDIFNLIFHDGESIQSFTHRLNGQINDYYLRKEYERRYYLKLNNLVDGTLKLPKKKFSSPERDQDVVDEIISNLDYKFLPKFQTDPYRFVIFVNGDSLIKFEGNILKILNIEDKWYKSINGKKFYSSGIIEDRNPNIIQSLFIYCDIIDYQYVGDAYAPLLRNVVVDTSYLKTAWAHYDNPHYLNVNKSEITSIRVEIRDDTGEKIHFENGKVIIKLHFQPKRL